MENVLVRLLNELQMHAHNLEKLKHIAFWGTIKPWSALWIYDHKQSCSIKKYCHYLNMQIFQVFSMREKSVIYLSSLISYLQTNENELFCIIWSWSMQRAICTSIVRLWSYDLGVLFISPVGSDGAQQPGFYVLHFAYLVASRAVAALGY